MKRIIKYQVILAALSLLACPAATASTGALTVQGATYSCYFYTPFSEVFNSEVTFSSGGGLGVDIWKGNGFYVPLFNFFTGFYIAVDAITLPEEPPEEEDDDTVGVRSAATAQDLTLSIAGFATTPLPFVVGIGVMVLDYTDSYPFWFVGIRTDLAE